MSTPKADDHVQPLWRFVPLADFAPPPEPPQQVASRRLRALWRLLRSNDTSAQTPARAERDLRSLPEVQLEHLVPPIAWREALPALDEALGNWLEQGPEGVRFLVGPPGCGLYEILTLWAAERDWTIIAPPSAEQILYAGEDWLDSWPESAASGWVLPKLERCYLRHAQGLALIRQLFEDVTRGRRRPGLIACDSWAWAYLQRIWPIPAPEVFTLQAFDGEGLSAYFLQLANNYHRPLRVRNARTGADLLPLPDEQGTEEATSRVSTELRQLAAHCRGNLGVAWKYWRNALRATPDSTEAESQDTDDVATEDRDTIWWSSGRAPVLPVETGDELAFVLHALLLHDGLPMELMDSLLPLSHPQIASALDRLTQLGLVEHYGDRYRVAPLGYSATRQFLRGRGYLVDAF